MSHSTLTYSDNAGTDREDLETGGSIDGLEVNHVVGHSITIGTTYAPICRGNVYQTPTTAQTLEIVSDDATDNAAGVGAREVTLIGLDSSWNIVQTTVIPAGLTPVTIDTDFIRFFKGYVSSSGTYATATAGSHAGTLTIRDAATSTVIWAVIDASEVALGETEIGAYTVPAGKKALVKYWSANVDSKKSADILFSQRPNANDITSPYSGTMKVIDQAHGVVGEITRVLHAPMGVFDQYTDIGFLGRADSVSGIAINFEIQVSDR